MTFAMPVSSSRLMNTTPRAVGRPLPVGDQAGHHHPGARRAVVRSDAAVITCPAARAARMCATGCVP